jgi:hypothetical protein
MNLCIDCGEPALSRRRCADCAEEIAETPNWLPDEPRQIKVPVGTCSHPGCGHCVKAHGLCDKHYIRPSDHRACAACGTSFVSRGGRKRKFCSRPCFDSLRPARALPALRTYPPRACVVCDLDFRPAQGMDTKICSTACRIQALCIAALIKDYRAKHPLARVKRERQPRPPCCETGCVRPSRKREMCLTHYNQAYQPNRSHGPGYKDWANRNPEAHRRLAQNKRHIRRAARHGAYGEAVDRDRVGERDGWRCGICHRKVDRTKVHPHRMSPSLDHVVPIADGGSHTYANTRITHWLCNVIRGKRGGGEQLALLG